jgi:hypothetical protein
MSGYYYRDHPDYDSIKAESDAEKQAERRPSRYCQECRQQSGHAHGCPNEEPEAEE